MVRKLALATLLLTGFGVNATSASTIIDLTTAGAGYVGTGDIGGTFGVKQVPDQSTGTGVIDSFLRIHSNVTEQGYNTSLSTPLDTMGGGFTRALSLSEVPIITVGGVGYRQFLLDINQINSQNQNLLSLNQIQIFQSTSDRDDETFLSAATATNAPILGFVGTGWNEAFRLNDSVDPAFRILLDYGLNPGSGAGDMFLYVANSAFLGGYTNVILYSQFGLVPGQNASNDGFEEWAVVRATTPCVGCTPDFQSFEAVPEPGSVILLGSGLVFAAFRLGRRRKASQQ